MLATRLSRRLCPSLGGAAVLLGATLLTPTAAVAQTPPPGDSTRLEEAVRLSVEALIGDSVSRPADPRYSDVGEAIRRFSNRDLLSARTFLERAVGANPKLPPVGVLMAKLQLLSGNAAGLGPALEQAVQDDSADDPEPYLLLAQQALQQQRTIEADALYDKAVELIESYRGNAKRKRQFEIRAYQGRAVIAERRQNWEKAESDLRRWIEQEPDEASAYQRLGQVLFMFEQDAKDGEGFKAFRKAKELNEELPSPYVSAALMYTRRGATDRSMEAFERAFRTNNEDPTTLRSYAQALLQSGDAAKAKTILKQAREVAADQAAVWLLSGIAERMTGNTDAAEAFLLEALALQPGNREVINQLAVLLADRDSTDAQQRALRFAAMNQRLNQDVDDINVTLAAVYQRLGRSQQAVQILRQVLSRASLSADGKYLAAKVLAERNDPKNARILLEAAMQDDRGIFVERKAAEALLASL